MESLSQPQKKSNIPIIVLVSVIVACLCGAITLCLIVGLGFYALNRTATPNPPIESFDPIPTESLEDLFIPTPATEEPFDPELPQGGRGDNTLRKRVWDFILPMAEDDAGCKSPLPDATVIVVTVEPDNAGVWEETWSLFCTNDPAPVFRIIFTPNPDGNINFSPGLISK